MKKLILFLVIFLVVISKSYGTHLRAGEITYKFIGDATHYKYRVTVTTYTDWAGPGSTDNCSITIHFGDGDSANANRNNGSTFGLCGGSIPDGVLITPDTRMNVYEADHLYHGTGSFTIWISETNRNNEILNITDPGNNALYLYSQLLISPFLGPNSSPTLTNLAVDHACVGTCFEHNPGAFDPENDSLYYSLDSCRQAGGIVAAGWHFPDNMNAGSINPLTGDLLWCSPTTIGEFNIAILIKQYHYLPANNQWYFVGSVLRDMQIRVQTCTNAPPNINSVNDTCIVAGTTLNFTVTANDTDGNIDSLRATGGPLVTTPPATFSVTYAPGAATGVFTWTPGCSQVHIVPYLVTFKATDSGPPSLVDFESMFIRVIAPAPGGLTATPSGSSIALDWNQPICDTLGSNPLVKYLVYRKGSCDPWQPGPCETGVPAYTGYSLIATTPYNTTAFLDNNGGTGLSMGVDYSYIVVAVYADGSQSVASQHVCAKLVRDVPIITNVSVISTNATSGTIWTHWLKPAGSVTDLDTTANPPPYEYRLLLAGGAGYTPIASYNYPAYWNLTDTGFVSTLNTTVQHTYKIEFYSNGNLVGSTSTASSVFLTSVPGEKTISLSWTESVPWDNYYYFIYRESAPGSGIFNLIDSTTSRTYLDTNLINEVQYCYRILSKGEYSDASLPRPLMNYSEIRCDAPVDLVPPCQPEFDLVTSCSALQNTITWTNPNSYCCDDAVQINVYFAPTADDPLQLIYSTTNMSDSSYTLPVYLFDNTIPSVAGCYALTAVDSALHPNESSIIKKICVDNCPEYELPNVFTPNADGKNDLFTPLPGYRYVKDVDIRIYDRWGLLMFSTTDKDVRWDGRNATTNAPCPDGVYFYVCTVNEIRVSGIQPRIIKGFVQIIREGKNPDY
jgi:gliding motility-associated-like protein